MREGKTKNGFEFSIDENQLDNMELIDLLAQVDGGNLAAMPRAAEMMLGKDQKDRLYEHIRTEHGNVPIEPFMETMVEIMNLIGEKKS